MYRRTREEMPAGEMEVQMAEEEGIEMLCLTSPVRLIGKDGKVTHIECVRNEPGKPDESGRRRPEVIEGSNFTIPVDLVIPPSGRRRILYSFQNDWA
ncbi:MAG: hypothetical protein HS127_10265 [Planctomycetia bacterium]|nr:hypothetical protein [Planctomycetia bacterium]